MHYINWKHFDTNLYPSITPIIEIEYIYNYTIGYQVIAELWQSFPNWGS